MKIIRNEFMAWLQEAPLRTFTPGSGSYCPLASYLKDKTGRAHFVTQNYAVNQNALSNLLSRIPLDPWAYEFVRRVDIIDRPTISGFEAIDIMKEIK